MHTVFINTTKNIIGGRFDALKNAKDLKKLMYVECPLDGWKDEKTGYPCVVQQVADFIDTYNDVNNDFNLIVYADMVEVFELLKLNFFGADDVQQYMLAKLCTGAVTRLVASTLIQQLIEDGREPAQKPVLLLEMPKTKEPSSGADHSTLRRQTALQLLHFGTPEQLQEKLVGVESAQLCDIFDEQHKEMKIDLCEIYREYIQILVADLREKKETVDTACDNLREGMEQLFREDLERNLAVSEYYTNKKTLKLSLERYTKHNFLLQSFILDCINEESAYDGEENVKRIPELSERDWDKIKSKLGQKLAAYDAQRQKILDLNVDFAKLHLAPELYMLDRSKFGLNESGNISSDYVVQKAAEPQPSEKDGQAAGTDKLMDKQEELVEQSGVVQNWFGEEVYKLYDTDGDEYTANAKYASAAEYRSKAMELSNHHHDIFNKLNMHVKRAMANYSSRSLSNAQPILRKRHVNTGDSVTDSQKNDYMYAKKDNTGFVKETDPAESVIETSKQAYITIMLEYLKFDAGRGIAMKNIKKQCEWFINRITQIEESLKKLFWVMLVLAGTLFAVYLPFVLIQWENIVKNVDTILVALCSLAVPYLLLGVFYLVARGIQKRKMHTAWQDLVIISEAASRENKQSIEAYDALMTRYIPALRWLYEYVLDVDFHCDCCDIAMAKLAHHREKLFERSESLGNFLEDLDYDGVEAPPSGEEFPVEYANAFCEGEKNCDFYSIIDRELLDALYKKEGGGIE